MDSLKHFLVPLDGSAMAEAALPVAVGLARPLDAEVTLLHVQERSAPRTIHGEPHLREPSAALEYLERITAAWREAYSRIDWHVHPNRQADVARSINEHAVEMKADVVVLTTHGSGGLRDFLAGSIAQQVVRRGKTPTLIVRPPDQGGPSAPYQCQAVLVPLDGAHDSERALGYAGEISEATGAPVVLASVVPTVGTASGDLAMSATFSPSATAAMLDLAMRDLGGYLEGKASDLRQAGREVRTSISRGRAASGILEVAEEHQVNLVILATHGRAGLNGALSGSLAPRLLAELHQPVLLVRVEGDSTDKSG